MMRAMSTLDQFRLDGRTALVTGSGRGLGWEMARALAEAGARVLLHGRAAERLAGRVGELKQAAESVSDPFSLPLDHEVICRVCGEAITPDSVVFCQQCRTPHHGDCWKYYGACSVYGCGCKALARVPKKRGRQAL